MVRSCLNATLNGNTSKSFSTPGKSNLEILMGLLTVENPNPDSKNTPKLSRQPKLPYLHRFIARRKLFTDSSLRLALQFTCTQIGLKSFDMAQIYI